MARREYMLRVRLNDNEKARLQQEADRRGVSMSEVIKDYIKRLPKAQSLSVDGALLEQPCILHYPIN
jgi:antitoxin component of RelBE/YafQ-DinJ toxin-antitoxin module